MINITRELMVGDTSEQNSALFSKCWWYENKVFCC